MEAGSGPTGATHVLVVTNDRELRERLHVKGARTVPLQWLLNRLDLPVIVVRHAGQPSGHHRDRRRRAPATPGGDDEDPRPGEARPRRDDQDRAGPEGRPPQATPAPRRLTRRGPKPGRTVRMRP